jgi:hypothetical protein
LRWCWSSSYALLYFHGTTCMRCSPGVACGLIGDQLWPLAGKMSGPSGRTLFVWWPDVRCTADFEMNKMTSEGVEGERLGRAVRAGG